MKVAGQHAEIGELIDEGIPVAVLQRVVERVVPLVDEDGHADHGQFDCDNNEQQDAAGKTVLGPEIGS